MSVLQSANVINSLIYAANSTTGKSDQTLTSAVQSLKDGYGTGGSGGSGGSEEWVRPSEYPNYDYIDRTDMEAVFFTYDCRYAKSKPDILDYSAITVFVPSSGKYKLDRGYIDEDGFHVIDTQQYTSGTSAQLTLPNDIDANDYIVYRVTAVGGTSAHITVLTFGQYPGTQQSNTSLCQRCVEIYGRLPYVTSLTFGCLYLESFDVIDCIAITNLSNAWNGCRRLQKFNVSGWNTSNLTNVSYAWNYCVSLKKLDLSGWNTAKIENLDNTWTDCQSLEDLNLSGWNVSKINSAYYTWARCMMLKNLNLSGWANIKPTRITSAWYNCYVLEGLDLSGWNMSNVTDTTSSSNVWSSCYFLRDLQFTAMYVSFSLSNSTMLSDESLASVISSLPTVTTSKTLTLGNKLKNRLTTAQITSATEKGWSIA